MITLNTEWKDRKCRKYLVPKNFTYEKKFYVHEIAPVNLSKIYFLENAKKTCKSNNRDLNRDWKRKNNFIADIGKGNLLYTTFKILQRQFSRAYHLILSVISAKELQLLMGNNVP